ncbi:MAG: PadR family transcriptional regulator [Proteobacteria bacterium]|nr:PadR family transcriptional regulator [Pseudomonadota bacterium]
MRTQLKKGSLELCVLAVLSQADRYGYELVEMVSRHIDITEGTIYPLLRRCLNDGWFETYLKESDQGPPRKYYRMTIKGAEVYQEMRKEWDQFARAMQNLLQEVDSHARA